VQIQGEVIPATPLNCHLCLKTSGREVNSRLTVLVLNELTCMRMKYIPFVWAEWCSEEQVGSYLIEKCTLAHYC
jgi:hypothetical protein